VVKLGDIDGESLVWRKSDEVCICARGDSTLLRKTNEIRRHSCHPSHDIGERVT